MFVTIRIINERIYSINDEVKRHVVCESLEESSKLVNRTLEFRVLGRVRLANQDGNDVR